MISPRKTILIQDFPYFETGQDVVDKLTSSYIIDEYPCSEEPEEPENPEGGSDVTTYTIQSIHVSYDQPGEKEIQFCML